MKNRQVSGVPFLLEGVVLNAVMISYRRFTEVMPEHSHGENVYEIHLVTAGTGTVWLNEREYPVSTGDLYITGPKVLHEQIPAPNMSITEFGIYLQVESGGTGKELIHCLKENSAWCGKGSKLLLQLAKQILQEQEEALPGSVEKLPHLLAEFLIESIREILREKGQNSDESQPLILLPEEKFTTHAVQEKNTLLVVDEIFLYEYRGITLQELAKRLGFSERQTQRLLYRIYGKTFTEKKLEARMSAAVTLLQNSAYSITEISEQIGYSSMEHFSYAFQKYYGYAPSRIRKGTNS